LRHKENPMKILLILTSHDRLGDTGHKTGFWLEEFAAPYYAFKDAGAKVTLASPKGGQPPLDPRSDDPSAQTESTRRFKDDDSAKADLAHTEILENVQAADFDAVFYAGGHGPLWDLAEDEASIALIEAFWTNGKPVAAVCHAPGVLRHAKADGAPLVKGRNEAVGGTLPQGSGLGRFHPDRRETHHRTEPRLVDSGRPGRHRIIARGRLRLRQGTRRPGQS
jgi:putative intracellular protease/amidase